MTAPFTSPAARDWHAAARALEPEARAFIDGDYHPARSGETFATVNPAAVAAAERAFAAERRLDTGFVWINTIRVGDISVPFGGVKDSGSGRDKSLHAFDNVTRRKSVWVDLAEQT